MIPLLLAFAISRPAAADVARHALIVGHNEGSASERPLLFAEADAQRMTRTILNAGGTEAERTKTLTGPTRNELLHALGRLRAAVAADEQAGRDTLVLFFYSGHADAQGMHLGRQVVTWTELQTLLDRTGARVRVSFLDACESGAMTQRVRTKGATRAPSFAVELSDRLTASGQVVFTSSTADQASHESDAIGGSYFTHHLASALAGAADEDRDGRVTLEEAWAHVARETAFQTRDQREGAQTPTYAWDLTGTGHLVLTAPGQSGATLSFPAGLAGEFAVFDQARRSFVAQLSLDGNSERSVGLAPGTYIVQQRFPDHLDVARVTLTTGEHLSIHASGFDAVSYDDDVVKGALNQKSRRARLPEWSLSAGVGAQAYADPSDGILQVPPTLGYAGALSAIWPSGLRVGLDGYLGRGEGTVRPDVPSSIGTATANTWGLSGGWLSAPRLWRLGANVHFTRLSYAIEYPEYDVGDPQVLRVQAPGVGMLAGVYPGPFSIEVYPRFHGVRYVIDDQPGGVRFADVFLSLGVRQ